MVRVKAKIIKVDESLPNKIYWEKYIGKIFPVVEMSKDSELIHLDMTRTDEKGIRIWNEKEIKIIQTR